MVNPQYPTKKAADKGKGKEKDDKDVADENRACSAIRKLAPVSPSSIARQISVRSCGDVSNAFPAAIGTSPTRVGHSNTDECA